MLTSSDILQIEERGSDLFLTNQQIRYFIDGFPFLRLSKAATTGDGILRLSEAEVSNYISGFEQATQQGALRLVKFVPASGAATRMFKSLFSFLEEGKTDKSVKEFFAELPRFAFYQDLAAALANDGQDIGTAAPETIAEYFLTDKGLGYGILPKGLLRFHNYPDKARTPIEEHMVEGVHYANSGGSVQLHFTVSPEHLDKFEKLVVEKLPKYESMYGVKFYISFSEQKASTDTIAVNPDNTPFRDHNGKLLFRPAGHGALLENLGSLDADIVFTKNVDNIVPDRLKETTIRYKKALGGLLISVRDRIFGYLSRLDEEVTPGLLAELDSFFRDRLNVIPPAGFAHAGQDEKAAYFRKKLDRPLRVCGMVKNEGEPGGGPFWVNNADGTSSLQIVESAQVNLDDPAQKAVFQHATHFNPVDLVCSIRDRNGRPYKLESFRDPNTGFISFKSKDGKELKAQELPGLWNGSMADWNTIFAEVPLITFNPVKTVNDLLRDQHQ